MTPQEILDRLTAIITHENNFGHVFDEQDACVARRAILEPITALAAEIKAALSEDRVPLSVQGVPTF